MKMGTTLPCFPAGDADREPRPHIRHNAPCRPGVPLPRRNRRSDGCVHRRKAGSLGRTVGFVQIPRGSQCTSGRSRDFNYPSSIVFAMQATKCGYMYAPSADIEYGAMPKFESNYVSLCCASPWQWSLMKGEGDNRIEAPIESWFLIGSPRKRGAGGAHCITGFGERHELLYP
jgi:hypothetical protein